LRFGGFSGIAERRQRVNADQRLVSGKPVQVEPLRRLRFRKAVIRIPEYPEGISHDKVYALKNSCTYRYSRPGNDYTLGELNRAGPVVLQYITRFADNRRIGWYDLKYNNEFTCPAIINFPFKYFSSRIWGFTGSAHEQGYATGLDQKPGREDNTIRHTPATGHQEGPHGGIR